MALLSYDARIEAAVFEQLLVGYESVFSAPLPLRAALHKQILETPNSVAVTDGVRVLTYAQLGVLAQNCSDVLRQKGISCGMRVVIRMPNSLEFYSWYHAVHALGAVTVLIPSLLHAREVERIFAQCQPDAVISTVADCAELLQACGLSCIPVIDPCEKHKDAPLQQSFVGVRSCDDPAVILYTSGSTGEPRGIVLSARNILVNALQSYVRMLSIGLDTERFIAALPLAHSFGHMTVLWLPLVSGSAVYVIPAISRAALKQAFHAFQPTMFFGVPALYGALCMTSGLNVNSVKLFVSGGDFLPKMLSNAFAMLYGRYICPGYGLSEASPVVGLNIFPGQDCTESVTPILPGIAYKLVADGVEAKGAGELWIKGDNVMLGYFSANGMQGLGLSEGGWLATGDMARKKSDGSLLITGRRKEIIIFKGFNIYPQEVENALLAHPAVLQALVFEKSHDTFGQVPVACVVLRQGMSFEEKSLIEHCKMCLASYKIPHKVIYFNEFPLNHLGKIDRRTVKKTLVC